MSEVLIRVFHTHIEVYPYSKGDKPRLEKYLSKYDRVTHSFIPMCYYILNDVLYMPRGVQIGLLVKEFNTTPVVVRNYDKFELIEHGESTLKPKSNIQAQGMDFLTCDNEFKKNHLYSQFSLNLDTGDGKTYAAVTAILKLKIKAIIITHQEKLKNQWIQTLLTKTTLPPQKILDIEGSNIIESILNGTLDPSNYDIFCINHQSISTFARENSWLKIRDFFKAIKVGIKVVDECHLFFENSIMIDYFSNVYKSFYLTATFTRSDEKEIRLFNMAYSSAIRFGEETFNYEEKRKHIVFVVVYFKSEPMYGSIPKIETKYGFSSYKYIDYELEGTSNNAIMRVLYKIIDQTKNLDGKFLIITPKTETTEYVASKLSDRLDQYVGTVHSKNPPELNYSNLEKKYISSTVKSTGTGVDIKDLRVIINLEPIGSNGLADQVRGRLREYSPDKNTYFFYPVDTSIPKSIDMLNRITPTIKKKVKEMIFMKMNV